MATDIVPCPPPDSFNEQLRGGPVGWAVGAWVAGGEGEGAVAGTTADVVISSGFGCGRLTVVQFTSPTSSPSSGARRAATAMPSALSDDSRQQNMTRVYSIGRQPDGEQ